MTPQPGVVGASLNSGVGTRQFGSPSFQANSGPPPFEASVRQAAETVSQWPVDEPVRLAKPTSNLFRPRAVATAGLDLSAFSGVYEVDPLARRAVVGGLTTYEDLVAATLPHGLVPLCVPQLKTITLGGAVTGMGIEAASFRNGCPHESVTALDVLTGTGDVVHAIADGPDRDLFFGFANSYGTLGYAVRLEIQLEPVTSHVALEHVPFADIGTAAAAIGELVATGHLGDRRIDYLDGTVFSDRELYLTVGTYVDEPEAQPSDYTGMSVYYESIRRRRHDLLTTHDYLWRWDTDWFWCSRAFGVQRPAVRRLWPKSKLRSDTYWKLVALDRRHGLTSAAARLQGRPPREYVVQDVEIPLAALPEFMEFFHREVGIAPVWLCPLRQRDPGARWPLYAFDSDEVYVNVGFWSTVPRPDGDPADGRVNRLIEAEVTRLGGRKSLYSTSFYDRDEFFSIYGGDTYWQLKERYDPSGRFADLFQKCVSGV